MYKEKGRGGGKNKDNKIRITPMVLLAQKEEYKRTQSGLLERNTRNNVNHKQNPRYHRLMHKNKNISGGRETKGEEKGNIKKQVLITTPAIVQSDLPFCLWYLAKRSRSTVVTYHLPPPAPQLTSAE